MDFTEPRARLARWLRIGVASAGLLALFIISERLPDESQWRWFNGLNHSLIRDLLSDFAKNRVIADTFIAQAIATIPPSYDWFILCGLILWTASQADKPIIKPVVEWLVPPPPAFLTWRRPSDRLSPWRFRGAICVDENAWTRLVDFAYFQPGSGPDGRFVLVDGLYGPRGVGKTRLAVEWLRQLRSDRWHTGELVTPVPDGWKPKRKTAIIVDVAHHMEAFWASLDALANPAIEKDVRLVFDSAMDFNLMVEGRSAKDVDKLRLLLHRDPLSSPAGSVAQRNWKDEAAIAAKAVETRRGHDLDKRPTLRPAAQTFYRVGPIDGDLDRQRRVGRAIMLEGLGRRKLLSWPPLSQRLPSKILILDVIRAAQGRPKYLLELGGSTPRLPIDEDIVARDEAQDIIEDAVRAFGGDGVLLALTAALGCQGAIQYVDGQSGSDGLPLPAALPAEIRRRLAAGNFDRHQIAKVFRESSDGAWAADLARFTPAITNPHVAREVLFLAISRLQGPDISAFIERAFDAELDRRSVQAFQTTLAFAVASSKASSIGLGLALLPDDLVNLGHVYALNTLVGAAKAPVDDTFGQNQSAPPTVADQRRLESLTSLGRFAMQAAQVRAGSSRVGGDLVSALIAQTCLQLIDMAHTPQQRRSLLKTMGQTVGSGNIGPELDLIADDEAWLRSSSLSQLLGYMTGPLDETSLDLDWLAPAISAWPLVREPQDPIALSDALRAFELMDQSFQEAPTGELVTWTPDEVALVTRLLASEDQVGTLGATWALFWRVGPRSLDPFADLEPDLMDALLGCANDRRLDFHIWKRAAAVLGKLGLGPIYGDPVYRLAVWADDLLADKESVPPTPPLIQPRIPIESIESALKEAEGVLATPRNPSDAQYAALLVLAYRPNDPIAIDAIEAVAADRLGYRPERQAMVLRLWQIASDPLGRDAIDALTRLVRSRDADVVVTAFLALCALGSVARLARDDLKGEPFDDRFVETRAKLMNQVKASPIVVEAKNAAPVERVGPQGDLSARLLHQISATDETGRKALYALLVNERHELAFLAALEAVQPLDLEAYGQVLTSHYSDDQAGVTAQRVAGGR